MNNKLNKIECTKSRKKNKSNIKQQHFSKNAKTNNRATIQYNYLPKEMIKQTLKNKQ